MLEIEPEYDFLKKKSTINTKIEKNNNKYIVIGFCVSLIVFISITLELSFQKDNNKIIVKEEIHKIK